MQVPYVYAVTKYDPADFRADGGYVGPHDPPVSDHGPFEAAYLRAVVEFAHDSGVDRVLIREPGVGGINFGLEPHREGYGLHGLFPPDLEGFSDGAEVSLEVAVALVRAMLRDDGAWCRLEVDGRFAVHVGFDQYLYVGSSEPCERAVGVVTELGLFPVRRPVSPHALDADELERRPTDDGFWDEVRTMARDHGRVLVQEQIFARPPVLRRADADDVAAVASAVAPRSLVQVWPDLPGDDLPGDGPAGPATAGSEEREVGDPAATAVVPDPDGVLRARWLR